MSGYSSACEVEKQAEAILLPYIEQQWPDCTYYPTRHHRLIQKVCGDLLVKKGQATKYIEVKAERENEHSNFFIETWSNKARRTLGWFHSCQADWLWYFFLRERHLHVWLMQELKDWARAELLHYPEKRQSRYDQLNDTWGRCVPIAVLGNALPSFRGPIVVAEYTGASRSP